ncbi:Cthe_2314 family HEPN domain-containing protein [Chromobacterium haemolyticum]|uniref:Cthe_2314 family HEPN domain-containing protein n=1 Tax=Chromobacterium haemolyticum TaxID=394935 RepID=UPI00244744BD|nr:Cthe_2314 family HEPN domain-containing protein [Chromobacterium haemolyticum]MDH0342051.1 Cthe_2314 family HEPN domain-containing protein [Chromobacterium haemolyticum]
MKQSDENQDSSRQGLIDHPALQVLIPHLHSYSLKGLTVWKSGGKKFAASAVEIYAQGVFERVSELDTALAALRMALGFVMELDSQQKPDPAVYRYHYENFVLRVIGFVDRAHRLVGSALLMDKAKFEAIRGNLYVQNQVRDDHSDVLAALQRVDQVVKNYRVPRNELIHSTAFSSRELGLFMSVQQLGMDTKGIDVDELARDHFSQGSEEIALTILSLVEALTNLLCVLAPLFTIAAAHDCVPVFQQPATE